MAEWCARFTRDEAIARLEAVRIPAGPVNSPRQVLSDEAIRSADAFHPVEYPGAARPVPLVKTPFGLSRTPPSIRRRPPTAGEHTDEVLQELGYTADRIAALRGSGVV